MKKFITQRFGVVLFVLTLVAVVSEIGWAVDWYNTSVGTQKGFTPGDLGSAFGIANFLATMLLAYLAWKAYIASMNQLNALEVDQRRQFVERTLSAAISDFRERFEEHRENYPDKDFRSSFHHAYQLCAEFDLVESERIMNLRYKELRTANYVLRPLSSWCRWITSIVDLDANVQKKELAFIAARIVSIIGSEIQVYLVMCSVLDVKSIAVEYMGYNRKIHEYEPIIQFLSKYAPTELDEIRFGNQGAFNKINDMMKRVGWCENADVRSRFLGGNMEMKGSCY